MARALFLLLVMFGLARPVAAQVDSETLAEAKRKMAERQQERMKRGELPSTAPTTRKVRPIPKPKLVSIWKIKPDAPPEIQQWYARFPAERQRVIQTYEAQLQLEEGKLDRIVKRRVRQNSTVNTFGQTRYAEDRGDASKKRQEIKAQKNVIVDMRKQVEGKKTDTMFLPFPEFKNRRGGFGRLGGMVRIVQIIDKANCLITHAGVSYWLEGCDTSALADDQHVVLDTPVIVAGPKQYGTVLGGGRTVYLLKPFDWTQYLDAAEVTEAEAKAFWEAAPVHANTTGGVRVLKPIAPQPKGLPVAVEDAE